MSNTEDKIKLTVQQTLELQREVEAKIAEIKDAQSKIDETWASVERTMIDNDIKSIKGDWGSLTIAERIGWDTDEELLPKKFFKKVVDVKKLTDTYKLEGKAPKGATPKYTKYLTKRFK